ncbi:MAG: NAD-dependent epimerase/dehydratase family protein [Eubacteriales bacterium]
MHILVTGGAGYIDSHIVKEQIKKRYQVTVLDNLSKGWRGFHIPQDLFWYRKHGKRWGEAMGTFFLLPLT